MILKDFFTVFGFIGFVLTMGAIVALILESGSVMSAKKANEITFESAKEHLVTQDEKEYKLNKAYYKWRDKMTKKINKEILKSARDHCGDLTVTVGYKDEYKNKFTIEKFLGSKYFFKKMYKRYGYIIHEIDRGSKDSYTLRIIWSEKDVDRE